VLVLVAACAEAYVASLTAGRTRAGNRTQYLIVLILGLVIAVVLCVSLAFLAAADPVRIGLIGKYSVKDAYLSVFEALRHAGFAHSTDVEVVQIPAEEVSDLLAPEQLGHLDGIVIPGGFGERGIEGKVAAAGFARENGVPCLGLCLGLQTMVIEFARNAAGLKGAHSGEVDSQSPHPVIDIMDDQQEVVNKGGTMRLGAYIAVLNPGSQIAEAYGTTVVSERHRHRFEVNPRYRNRLEEAGLGLSGTSPDGRLVEFIELPGHPYWVGTQAHPEFKSRPDKAHPLFKGLVAAALDRSRSRLAVPEDLAEAVPADAVIDTVH